MTISSAWSKLPSIESTSAPCIMACASFPRATLPSGISTTQSRPANAAYAASEADVLPVEAQVTVSMPSSRALVTPTVMPLSLNDPVGLVPSNLTHRFCRPSSSSSLRHLRSCVPPSLSDTALEMSSTGIASRYLHTDSGLS